MRSRGINYYCISCQKIGMTKATVIATLRFVANICSYQQTIGLGLSILSHYPYQRTSFSNATPLTLSAQALVNGCRCCRTLLRHPDAWGSRPSIPNVALRPDGRNASPSREPPPTRFRLMFLAHSSSSHGISESSKTGPLDTSMRWRSA
jgi:hypothetical protein